MDRKAPQIRVSTSNFGGDFFLVKIDIVAVTKPLESLLFKFIPGSTSRMTGLFRCKGNHHTSICQKDLQSDGVKQKKVDDIPETKCETVFSKKNSILLQTL